MRVGIGTDDGRGNRYYGCSVTQIMNYNWKDQERHHREGAFEPFFRAGYLVGEKNSKTAKI